MKFSIWFEYYMMVDKIMDIFFLFEDVRFKLEELEIEFVEGKVII